MDSHDHTSQIGLAPAIMAQAVAKVARRINSTVEEGKDSVDLSGCNLISFPDGVFKMLRSVTPNIHKITLANNELKALSSKFFSTFTQLRELDLQGNVLSKLPDELGVMEHLISINLSNNKFTIFPLGLTQVPSLQHINLEGNGIAELPLEKLSAMPALRCVDMRSNPLDKGSASVAQTSLSFELLTQ